MQMINNSSTSIQHADLSSFEALSQETETVGMQNKIGQPCAVKSN